MVITPLKILICFALALVTTIVVRFVLKEKRDLWFTRSMPRSLITVRGAFGQYLSLGYPVTWQGYIVLCALLLIIACEITLVIYYPWF